MELDLTPETLTCSACGNGIDDQGYLPAAADDGTYRPKTDAALCAGCGFNEVGFAGCAPELEDVLSVDQEQGREKTADPDPDPDDVLLHVRVTDTEIEVVSEKG